MQTVPSNLFTRDDTFFGVCEALGQDLRFNPNWMRGALAVMLLWDPLLTLASYAGAAAIVLISRFAFPSRNAPVEAAEAETPVLQVDNDQHALRLAA